MSAEENLRKRTALAQSREWQSVREINQQQGNKRVSTTRKTKQGDSVARPPKTDALHTGLDDFVAGLGDAWDEIEQVAARERRMAESRADRAARIRTGAEDGAR